MDFLEDGIIDEFRRRAQDNDGNPGIGLQARMEVLVSMMETYYGNLEIIAKLPAKVKKVFESPEILKIMKERKIKKVTKSKHGKKLRFKVEFR